MGMKWMEILGNLYAFFGFRASRTQVTKSLMSLGRKKKDGFQGQVQIYVAEYLCMFFMCLLKRLQCTMGSSAFNSIRHVASLLLHFVNQKCILVSTTHNQSYGARNYPHTVKSDGPATELSEKTQIEDF